MAVTAPAAGDANALHTLRAHYAQLLHKFKDAQGAIHDTRRPTRVLIMVSKADHCLRELLAQWRRHDLPMDIVAVVSTHRDLEPLATAEGIAFHHLPVHAETRLEQEAALLRCIDEHAAELVVLARYMQVLSEGLCQRLEGKVINIHHSFLPGFKAQSPMSKPMRAASS